MKRVPDELKCFSDPGPATADAPEETPAAEGAEADGAGEDEPE